MLRRLDILTKLVALLCFVVSAFLLYQRFSPQNISFDNVPNSYLESGLTEISTLQLPSLNLELSVFTHAVTGSNWPLSTAGVVHILGTNIYYGHNWPRILGSLHQIKLGDLIIKSSETYSVSEIKTISPSDTSVLSLASDTTLIIYTCTGFLDRDRLVVLAKKYI